MSNIGDAPPPTPVFFTLIATCWPGDQNIPVCSSSRTRKTDEMVDLRQRWNSASPPPPARSGFFAIASSPTGKIDHPLWFIAIYEREPEVQHRVSSIFNQIS